MVTLNSKQEKRPDFKRSRHISIGQSIKYVRLSKRSIIKRSFRAGNIPTRSLHETKKPLNLGGY